MNKIEIQKEINELKKEKEELINNQGKYKVQISSINDAIDLLKKADEYINDALTKFKGGYDGEDTDKKVKKFTKIDKETMIIIKKIENKQEVIEETMHRMSNRIFFKDMRIMELEKQLNDI